MRYDDDDPKVAANRAKRQEIGRLSARAQWGTPRTARMADLSTEQREVILSLIEAARRGEDITPLAEPFRAVKA